MKKLILALTVIIMSLMLISCGSEDKISSVEDMAKIDGVTSVKKNEEKSGEGCLVYNISFVSEGLKLNAQMALPENYKSESYRTVLYFSELGLDYDLLKYGYAKEGVIVVRFSARGYDGNEGTKDLCGEDVKDVLKLFDIINSCDFIKRGGIVTAGSSEGSMKALKLASERSDKLLGCAVINVISELQALIDARGEQIKEYNKYIIGGTYDEMPEEYDKRSAVYFADKIDVPVLILIYKDHPLLPEEQGIMLVEAIKDAGGDSEVRYINKVGTDFMGKSLEYLISWTKSA